MSMDPPKVLLEHSFLVAVADAEHPQHSESVTLYRALLDQFERQEILLVAVGDHLRAMDLGAEIDDTERAKWFVHRPRRGVFAPVDPLYVGFQHRRAAAATTAPNPTMALTLVMLSRHKIRRIATADTSYEAYDLDVLPLLSA